MLHKLNSCKLTFILLKQYVQFLLIDRYPAAVEFLSLISYHILR